MNGTTWAAYKNFFKIKLREKVKQVEERREQH
jgi:hypothetical protein